jgi:FkbH-like protein
MSLTPAAIAPLLDRLFVADPRAAARELRALRATLGTVEFAAVLRLAVAMDSNDPLYFQQLHNLWCGAGRPPMKPSAQTRRMLLLTDYTAAQLAAPLEVMAAARGVALEVRLPPFDSVEQQVLAGSGQEDWQGLDLIALSLSEHWLNRWLGGGALVTRQALERTLDALSGLIEGLVRGSQARILVATLLPPTYPSPNGYARLGTLLGRRLAIGTINAHLSGLASGRVGLVDTETAIHLAGGRSALGRRGWLLAKMAYEPAGAVAVARELAASAASCFGQGHRALVLDWDNTLWGGEIGELGASGIVSGHDSPEAGAYRLLQNYIKGLKSSGVLIAGASRNDPRVAALIDESDQIALGSGDFAALAIDFQPKSRSLGSIAAQLGFGPEYMLFVDDSPFELAEVFCAHPAIDLLQACPEADLTLERLSAGRWFVNLFLESEDLARAEMAARLGRARQERATFASNEEFLASLDIELAWEPWGAGNQGRILQLIQKTNQFNLTTRRHGESAILEILARGGEVLAFSYRDCFGSQGVVSVLATLPGAEPGERVLDTWLMSCRVLNRSVEQGIFDWYTATRPVERLVGHYVPTPKNALVAGLLPGLGFEPLADDGDPGPRAAAPPATDPQAGASRWLWRRESHRPPTHFVKQVVETPK